MDVDTEQDEKILELVGFLHGFIHRNKSIYLNYLENGLPISFSG